MTCDVNTALHQVPRGCTQSGCTGYPDEAAGTTKERSDEGRYHNRPFAELTYSARLEYCSLPVWTPGSHCGMCKKPPPTPTHLPPSAMTEPGPRWTGMPPTSSPPMSPEPPGKRLASQGQFSLTDRHRSGGHREAGGHHAVQHGHRMCTAAGTREPPFGAMAGSLMISSSVAQIRSFWV